MTSGTLGVANGRTICKSSSAMSVTLETFTKAHNCLFYTLITPTSQVISHRLSQHPLCSPPPAPNPIARSRHTSLSRDQRKCPRQLARVRERTRRQGRQVPGRPLSIVSTRQPASQLMSWVADTSWLGPTPPLKGLLLPGPSLSLILPSSPERILV